MKNLKHILTAVIVLFSISTFGQIKKDSSILKYIETQVEFISFQDTAKIPDSIKPYLNSITVYMNNKSMNLADYWIWTSYIRTDSNLIFIPICHYDGFAFKMKLEEKNKEDKKDNKEGETVTVINFNGNASGKDGNLVIDMNTKNILRFSLWQ